MPKIIPELKETLINAARNRIINSQSHDLMIREVASDCNTAVGTVYNYFSSKENLLAAVMLEDWLNTYSKIITSVSDSESFSDGLRAFDSSMREFVDTYRPTWKSYSGGYGIIGEHHSELIKQLSSAVTLLAEKHGRSCSENELTVVSEILLAVSQRERDDLEKVIPIIENII